VQRPGSRTITAVVLGLYVVVAVVFLLGPSAAPASDLAEAAADAGRSLGLPESLSSAGRVEFVLNALAFAPIVALASVFLPALNWRDWTALGFLGSFAIEAAQVLMTDRSATYVDIVANTLGATLGAVVAESLGLVLERRRRERGAPPADVRGSSAV
jgi:hypothetical protein